MKYNELQQKVHSIHIVADFLICQRYPTQDSSFMIATEGASDGFGAYLCLVPFNATSFSDIMWGENLENQLFKTLSNNPEWLFNLDAYLYLFINTPIEERETPDPLRWVLEVPVNNAGFKTSFLTHEGLTRSYNRVIKSAFTTTEIRDKQIDIPDLPYTIVNAKYLYKASNGVAKVDSSGNKKDLYYSQMDASDIPDCWN